MIKYIIWEGLETQENNLITSKQNRLDYPNTQRSLDTLKHTLRVEAIILFQMTTTGISFSLSSITSS